jgi:hypothetical protein
MVQDLGDVQIHECDHLLSCYSGLRRQISPKEEIVDETKLIPQQVINIKELTTPWFALYIHLHFTSGNGVRILQYAIV